MADTSLGLVKRKRKQAWRTINNSVRSLQSNSQRAMRYSQKVLNQPSAITPKQLEKLTDFMELIEGDHSKAALQMGYLLQLFQSGY